ncbi:MAG: hypothetical protein QN134_09275 [Armatimonadota bacterium]|nr:hypothetical protein [Armatimonadota bacterium]
MHLAVAILTAGGLTVQAAGVLAVRSDGAALVALQDAIERRSAPVLVSGAEPVLRALAPLYFRRVLLRVDGPEALRDLVRTLSRYRVREWTYVPFTGARFDRRRIERWSEEAG